MNSVDADAALRNRLLSSMDRLIKVMPFQAKMAAIESADLSDFLLSLARALPASPVDSRHAADVLAHEIAFKRRVLEGAGGTLTAEEVRNQLAYKSVQAVYKAVQTRRLFVVDDGGTMAFPAIQFDADNIRPVVAKLLAAAPDLTPWAILQALTGGEPGPDGRRRIDLVRGSDEDQQRLVRFVEALGD